MTLNASTELGPVPSTVPAAAPTGAASWDIDPVHASAGFKVRHLMVSYVRGQLGTVTGTAVIDEDDPTRSRVDVSIDAAGIETRDARRDEHLRSADFLDVANHPKVTFRSTSVRPAATADGGLEVTGDLTIRGVTRPVTLAVEPLGPAVADPWGNTKRGTTARARIDRRDFGLRWNAALETGGFIVGDEVAIEIDVELVRRKV
jgi:polyisoprenoid-binding protein YceI